MNSLIHKPLSLITKTRIRGLDAFNGSLELGNGREERWFPMRPASGGARVAGGLLGVSRDDSTGLFIA